MAFDIRDSRIKNTTSETGERPHPTAQRYMHLSPAALDAAIRLLETANGIPWRNTGGGEKTGMKELKSHAGLACHPRGNVTGVVNRSAVRAPKEPSLLRDVVPGLKRVAVLTGGAGVGPVQSFATANGIQLDIVDFRSADRLEPAFEKLAANSPQGLFVGGGPLTLANMPIIARLAAARRWPSVSESRELPDSGGLMSYGGRGDARQVAARYVDRILKGAKPSDLPLELQEQRRDLVINIGAAKRLGLAIPDAVSAQAAEIIQ